MFFHLKDWTGKLGRYRVKTMNHSVWIQSLLSQMWPCCCSVKKEAAISQGCNLWAEHWTGSCLIWVLEAHPQNWFRAHQNSMWQRQLVVHKSPCSFLNVSCQWDRCATRRFFWLHVGRTMKLVSIHRVGVEFLWVTSGEWAFCFFKKCPTSISFSAYWLDLEHSKVLTRASDGCWLCHCRGKC
jgi:hypothetical protein